VHAGFKNWEFKQELGEGDKVAIPYQASYSAADIQSAGKHGLGELYSIFVSMPVRNHSQVSTFLSFPFHFLRSLPAYEHPIVVPRDIMLSNYYHCIYVFQVECKPQWQMGWLFLIFSRAKCKIKSWKVDHQSL
jgi:hypothetical protein